MGRSKSADSRLAEIDLTSIDNLREAVTVFFSRPGPRFLAKNAAVSWLVRGLCGPPSLMDVPVVASVVAWWPLQEWLAHKYLLHLEPTTIAGRPFDPLFARRHRAHHIRPRDLDLTLLPIEVIRGAFFGNIAFWLAAGLGGPRRTTTGIATFATMALVYEWTHFLVHTSYRPKSRFFKRVRRNHRLHHFHNESYWLSFVWPGVDRLLGTEPDPRSVPHSDTATNLFGLA